MNLNGTTYSVKNVVKLLNKISKKKLITMSKNPLPVVGEIHNDISNSFINSYEFTTLEKGLLKTILFYQK